MILGPACAGRYLCGDQDAGLTPVYDLALISLVTWDFGGIEIDRPYVLHVALQVLG
jgi:hypothetical protein